MKLSKKIMTVSAAVLASLSLAACGNTNSHKSANSGQKTAQQTSNKKPRITGAELNKQAHSLQNKDSSFAKKISYDGGNTQKVEITLQPKYQTLFKSAENDVKKNTTKKNATDKKAIKATNEISKKVNKQVQGLNNKNNNKYSDYTNNINGFEFTGMSQRCKQGITDTDFI